MGLLTAWLERRDSLENPKTSLSNPDAWLWDAFGASKSKTGVAVNERTSLQSVAVFACVRILANTLASLPWVTYERLPVGKQRASGHPLAALLHDRPNPEMSSFAFRETLQGHLLLWGNAYAEIERSKSGRPVALWPLMPNVTAPTRTPNGVKVYETYVEGTRYPVPAEDILHVPGLGFDGQVGYSPIRLQREAVGLALAAEQFGAQFFGNGSRPSGVLQHPGKLSQDAKLKMRESWQSVYGGLSNAHRVAILEEGLQWQSIGVPPDDAQFLETRKFQTTEIARMFGVPPHMLADLDRATFSNIEHQSIEYVIHSVRPWLVRWEQICNWSLFGEGERDRYFSEFLVEGLLRGDSTQRATFYTQLFQVGALSVNDIREKENLNPVDGGDQRFVPLNMVPLDMARAVADKPKSAAPAPAAQREIQPSTFLPLCRDVLERMLRRELVQLRRAAKRGPEALGPWVDEFYAEHRDAVQRAWQPVLEAVAGLVLPLGEAVRYAEVQSAACAHRAVTAARSELATLTAESPAVFESRVLSLAQQWEAERVAPFAQADADELARALAIACRAATGDLS